MAEINVKLDRILTSFEKLTTRIDRLENSVSATHNDVSNLDQMLTQRCDELEGVVKQKTNLAMFADLKDKVQNLEDKHDKSTDQEAKNLDYITKVKRKFESYFLEAERAKLSDEGYLKRLNGIDELFTNPWETREKTKLNKFLSDGLRLENTESLHLVDFYRLPQRPVNRNGYEVIRPIICKRSKIKHKRSIMSVTKHL